MGVTNSEPRSQVVPEATAAYGNDARNYSGEDTNSWSLSHMDSNDDPDTGMMTTSTIMKTMMITAEAQRA